MNETINEITLACPKCHAKVDEIKTKVSENGLLHYVVCNSCQAFVVEDTLEKAIDQWNKGHAAPGIG